MRDLRYRPGCVADVPNAIPMLQGEYGSLGSKVCSQLASLISQLMEQEVVKAYVIDEGPGERLRWFGLSAFVAPAALAKALDTPSMPFRQCLLESALRGESPFLSQTQISARNAEGNLSLTVLFCQPDLREYTEAEGGVLFRVAFESFCFAHEGFGLSGFWQEVSDPTRAGILLGLGLETHRRVTNSEAVESVLLNYTPERAAANPAYAMSFVFNRVQPRFGFSMGQQQLLESALIGWSDRDFASKRGLSDDAVKKRWRAIYSRVALLEPGLLDEESAGSSQRRLLLGYLRRHLEELRPYQPGRAQKHRPSFVDA